VLNQQCRSEGVADGQNAARQYELPRIMKTRRLLFARILAVGLASLALLVGAAFFGWTKIYIPRLRHHAETHWAAIGRPMPEFGKQLQRVEENDSLRALTLDLEPFGVKSFYKAQGGKDPNTMNIPKEVTDVLHPTSMRSGDQVDLEAQRFSYLKDHAGDLDRLYRGIRLREPAVWSFVPQDGMTLRVASFLTARGISQLMCVDALHKLEQGDEKGAADASAAALKMTYNLGEQPILISLMIRVAIESLFAEVIARLPEDPEGLKQLAKEVETSREKWRAAMQTETWGMMQVVDYLGFEPNEFRKVYGTKSLIRKIQISFTQSLLEGDCSLFIACMADRVRISGQVRDLALSDLGVKEMHEASSRSAPVLTPARLTSFSDIFQETWYRSWIRVNAALLLREQAELIRATRAQVQAGKSGNLGEPESIVIPGAKWRINGDVVTNSVSLTLTPVPIWTTDNDIIGKTFFLLPLDGSTSWKFRPRQAQTK
jgi:hypothetical protein